jgi:CHASE1-domain containing sensor protein
MPERKQAEIAVRAFASAKPPLRHFDIYLAWRLLGTVEATDADAATEAAAKEFREDPRRLMAVRRG